MANYSNTIKDLELEIKSLRDRRADLVREIDESILQLQATLDYFNSQRKSKVFVSYLMDESPKTGDINLRQEVKKIIEQRVSAFVSSDWVTDTLINDYFPGRDKIKLRNQVSNILSKWKQGKFGKSEIVSYQYTSSKKDTVWGRKDWLNSEGRPKEQYFNRMLLIA